MRPLPVAALLAMVSISAQPVRAQSFIPRDALIAMVEVHKASLLRYLDAAPDSMLGYRPVPGVRTFAEQIEHAAWGDAFIAHTAITGSDKVPSFGDADKNYLKTKSGLRTYSVAAMDHTITMLKALPDGAMTEQVTQFGKQLPRYRALMELLDHFPWTLGQTVVYLRENGVTPPTYTPF
ncbi:MAG TPA: DinB family protein [Gemmatimonadales bacterium]|nr:DinB family protein [Gemmatimonadales bacterium]